MAYSRGVGPKTTFKTGIRETSTTDVEGLGVEREEIGPLGTTKYRWVKNASGSAMAVGDVASYINLVGGGASIGGTVSQISALTGSTSYIQTTAGNYDATANAYRDMWIYIASDVGGSGAAPEGQMVRIGGNTSNRFNFATDLSAAATSGDTFHIVRPFHVTDAAALDPTVRVAGVVMASAVAINAYCWVQYYGYIQRVTVNTGAQDKDAVAVAGTKDLISVVSSQGASINIVGPSKAIIGYFIASVDAANADLRSMAFLDL